MWFLVVLFGQKTKGKGKGKKQKQTEMFVREEFEKKREKAEQYLLSWQAKEDGTHQEVPFKFNKVLQTWIIRNVYLADAVNKECFQVLLRYLEGMQGRSRDWLKESAERVVANKRKADEEELKKQQEPEPEPEPEPEIDPTLARYGRSQQQQEEEEEQQQEEQQEEKEDLSKYGRPKEEMGARFIPERPSDRQYKRARKILKSLRTAEEEAWSFWEKEKKHNNKTDTFFSS